ncbi:type III restriction endonuclease [Spirochaetia bacterium]|nr:type III restriction endonuclease [Spirochaetia bacterium]
MPKPFFPQRPALRPTIYAYEDTNPQYSGMLKVGYTTRNVKERVAEQYPTARPGALPYKIVFEESSMRNDGSSFTDHDVHRLLRKRDFPNPEKTEWFKCNIDDVKAAVLSIKNNEETEQNRTLDFGMRPEQSAAVEKTVAYFSAFKQENPTKTPHFLWNAKMRFGKTFAAYKTAIKMKWKKVLVLTFKPAVQSAWEDDLKQHIDFKDWQFITRTGLTFENCDKNKPFVCFGSFQDFLGKNSAGGIKPKNEWVHATNWDCVILDEYHFGAWREGAKELFEAEDIEEIKFAQGEGMEYFNEDFMPITTNAYLYLSGTPFRAIASGEFIEDQIYNWTYSDEQSAKESWKEPPANPYASLPRMVMLTYQLPDSICEIARGGEYDEFDLNVFFSANGIKDKVGFQYKDEVQKWLDLIRGALRETAVDNLKLREQKPPMPFSHAPLLKTLNHTFWFLPSVASCYAMKNLLLEPQNIFYHDYKIIVAAGTKAGIGIDALPPIREAMTDEPLKTKTITLSCGKLTTGVSIKPWTGIFMLRNCSSPETYFQSAFRVQTPWTIKNPDALSPNKEEIVKEECYIFDFAPNRALRQIADYSCRLNVDDSNAETKVAEFIRFLPVLAYDGSSMKQIDAAGILDMALSGTTATLLARRWESALLVNVDNATLERLMKNEDAMKALMSIEGFRNINQEIETIINKSEYVKKAKQDANKKEPSAADKKQMTEEEKEYKSRRKQIQDKLIKFATRITVFMYLTDYREQKLTDVITQLEPALFKKVTGLTQKDFELLVSLGVFNSALMNDAVYKFKRYEDSSIIYTGVNKHGGEYIGGWDTILTPQDYKAITGIPSLFVNEPEPQYS